MRTTAEWNITSNYTSGFKNLEGSTTKHCKHLSLEELWVIFVFLKFYFGVTQSCYKVEPILLYSQEKIIKQFLSKKRIITHWQSGTLF